MSKTRKMVLRKINKKRVYDESYRKQCGSCNQLLPASSYHRDLTRWTGLACHCKDCIRKNSRKRQRKLKKEVFTHYSNGVIKCAKCDWVDIRALEIDHINNDGNKHRKKTNCRTGTHFYRWLKKNNYPEGYQVLCCNHNRIKEIEYFRKRS